jgi:hypothetical protein
VPFEEYPLVDGAGVEMPWSQIVQAEHRRKLRHDRRMARMSRDLQSSDDA